jgi:nucleoside-diphosphate-sugar epimerase
MGYEAFLELRRRSEKHNTRLLLRPSKVNKKRFAQFDGRDGVEIVWGDLTNAEDVRSAVKGVETVLHPAAMISPEADLYPEMARKINVGGTINLLDAIRAEPGGQENIRFVYVASVAQYGDRLPPIEWINVGDPLRPSVHDHYALTKMEAETAVIESGLRYWVTMRQTYIAIPDTLSLLDPIMFHQPLNQRIELITSRDAGYGLVQCAEAPDEFWGRTYNMSGGPSCRVSFADYMERVFSLLGLGHYQDIFERNWFALKNFHCGYYQDSYVLDSYLGHFRDSLDDHLDQLDRAFPRWMRIGATICPSPIIKFGMRQLVDPLKWIKNGKDSHVDAFFGSLEAWEAIPDWHQAPIVGETSPTPEPPSAQPPQPMSLDSLESFADSRGGRCLATEFADPGTRVGWLCQHGHSFDASPRLLISAGYWCPECAPNAEDQSGWNYGEVSKGDPYLARFV